MARIRSLHPGIYTDEAWASVSLAARWLGVGLCTEADDTGVFEWKPLQIKMRIFPADSADVSGLLSELSGAGIIMQFEVDGKRYGALRNFCRFQRPRKPKTWFPIPDTIKKFVSYACTVPQKSELDDDESDTVPQKSEKPSQMEDEGGRREEGGGRREEGEEKKKELGTAAVATRPDRDTIFEEFKRAYPKRSGGNPWQPARKLFDAAVRSGADPQAIVSAVKSGVGFDPAKVGTGFIPQAVKWLEDQRWRDYVSPPPEFARGHYAIRESQQFEAWSAHYRRNRGLDPPCDSRGGWTFPTEWPPALEAAE